MPTSAPFGLWHSPLSPTDVVQGTVRHATLRANDRAWWWSESRPEEAGRTQIVRCSFDGDRTDVLPSGYSAHSRVHEYGGGAFWLADETVFFVNQSDQRVYRLDPGFDPYPLTPEPTAEDECRFADGVLTADFRWIIAVRERHTPSGITNSLVAIEATGASIVELAVGSDFVMSPRLDPSSRWLCWIEWNEPNMAWDQTSLMVAEVISDSHTIKLADPAPAQSTPGESILQPEWDLDGRLWWISDRSNWWNLYHVATPGRPLGEPISVAPIRGEIATPGWNLAESRYAFLSDRRVVFAYSATGIDHLGVFDTVSSTVTNLSVNLNSFSQLRAIDTTIGCIGGSFESEPAVYSFLVGRAGAGSSKRHLSAKTDSGVSSSMISVGAPISFRSTNDSIAHGIFYGPKNRNYQPAGLSKPPLIVMIHGGPTAAATTSLQRRVQFWTSRGFAVVDVNYRGSTGFGRRYRDALWGHWGEADVDDCIAAARFLCESGRADPSQCFIRGTSSGAFTALLAMCRSDLFVAATVLYGVTDPAHLDDEGHKFERRYAQRLLSRSAGTPVDRASEILGSVLVMHGTADRVVPLSQAELLVEALRMHGVEYRFELFDGEGHGFRQLDSQIRSVEAEAEFYRSFIENAQGGPAGAAL